MASKLVVRRQRLDNALRASLTRHREALLEGLRKRFAPLDGEDEVLQSFERLYDFFFELLEIRENDMVAADEAHSAELRDDEAPRQRRDEAAAALYEKVVAVRRAANGNFGSDLAARLLDFDGSTSQDPLTLYRQASRVVERLRNPELEMPDSLLGGVPDRETWAAQLEPSLAELRAALDTVEEEARDFDLTLADKQNAMDEHDLDADAITRTVEGFLRLAARQDLSEEVRPARLRRRARRSTANETPEADPSDEIPDGSPPDTPASPEAPATGPPDRQGPGAGL